MSTLRLLTLVLAALATPLRSQEGQDIPMVAPEAAAIHGPTAARGLLARLDLEVLKPELDEAGHPVLDVNGQSKMVFQPVADGVALLPGDEFRYLLTLDNEGPDVEGMNVVLDLPAEGRLLPGSVTASVDAAFDLGSSGDPALRAPLFVDLDGERMPNPDWTEAPESFDLLLASLDRLAAGATATVTYHLVVR